MMTHQNGLPQVEKHGFLNKTLRQSSRSLVFFAGREGHEQFALFGKRGEEQGFVRG